ncbi:histidine kinase [Bizionia myxarmorum]|uniref:Histidine kinase n=1 Tax=Bizionia myxarmorum TaxID=291186 RepID=A0A5D0RG33_9FLAO|nr:histidine kinase [Bizionia myxarmorum]TYB79785.1 histidine kinase [Bizionia myxarmorum]
MIKTITLVICFLSFGFTPLFGQVMADSIPIKLELINNKHVTAIRTDKSSTFKEIQEQTIWKPYDASYTASIEKSLWLKFEIENSSKDTISVYLFSDHAYTLIYQQINKDYKNFKNGLHIPLTERTNKKERVFTEVIVPPFQKSQIYVRMDIKRVKAHQTPAIYSEIGYWKSVSSMYNDQQNSIGFIYFYIIALATILVFSLVFWFRLNKKLYLYYIGYLFFQIIYGFLVLNYTLAPFPNFFKYTPNLAYNLFEPVQFIFIGFYILFIMQLLQVKRYDHLLAKTLHYLGIICLVYAVTNLAFSYFILGGKYYVIIFTIVRFIILPINFILIFWVIYKVKHPLLNYFIIGQTCFFVGALLSTYIAYNNLHFVTGHFFNFKESPNIIFQIGLLAEVFCFSLALVKNVLILQKEKAETNDALIKQLQENQMLQRAMNLELDGKVQKKTDELIQLYSEIEREREQKIKDDFTQKIRETEMIALRSQMNPHFIFNSMSAIKSLIMTQRNDDAISYLDDFSSLLRGILQNSNRQKITVEEELEILDLYLSIEKSRIGPNFNYTIQVESKETLSQYEIPPLLLQPIVENAIWHGLQPSLKAHKKLDIIFDTTRNLKIIIEDNGIGRKESAKKKKLHESMGTTIVQDRLTLYNHLNEHNIRFKITDLAEGDTSLGTRITLTYNN